MGFDPGNYTVSVIVRDYGAFGASIWKANLVVGRIFIVCGVVCVGNICYRIPVAGYIYRMANFGRIDGIGARFIVL